MASVIQQANTWQLQGDLVVEDIVTLLNATQVLTMGRETVLDFNQVRDVDTSAISFILEIKRRAQRENATIRLTHLSSNLSSLMQLYGVNAFVIA